MIRKFIGNILRDIDKKKAVRLTSHSFYIFKLKLETSEQCL